jgi:hypothetical protein
VLAGLVSAIRRSTRRERDHAQPETEIVTESPTFREGIRAQMEMTRRAVATGEDKQLQDTVHPALWERLGPLRTLQRRPDSSKVI